MNTYGNQILFVFQNRPNHCTQVYEEGDDDQHENGHTVIHAHSRKDEVKVDYVHLRHHPRHERGQVVGAGPSQSLARVVDGDAFALPHGGRIVQVVQAHGVDLN